jgi:predicted metallopeptidase
MESQSCEFDFTAAMRRLCQDMTARLPQLRHIDLSRVAISICQTRNGESHGTYATLTPLRFEAGATTKNVRGRRYGVEPVRSESGEEYLYILNFYLPRFLNTPLEENLSTVIHELWHISPTFDGDLRRHEGRCYAHGSSQKAYDALMDQLTQQWLALDPPEHLYEFMLGNFDDLLAEHGGVTGAHWQAPKLVPL